MKDISMSFNHEFRIDHMKDLKKQQMLFDVLSYSIKD